MFRSPSAVEVGPVVGQRYFRCDESGVGALAVLFEVQPQVPRDRPDLTRAVAAVVLAYHDLLRAWVVQEVDHAPLHRVGVEVHLVPPALLAQLRELRVSPLGIPPSLPASAATSAAAPALTASVVRAASSTASAPAPAVHRTL